MKQKKNRPAPAQRADASVAETEAKGALSDADLDKVAGGMKAANAETQTNLAQALKAS